MRSGVVDGLFGSEVVVLFANRKPLYRVKEDG